MSNSPQVVDSIIPNIEVTQFDPDAGSVGGGIFTSYRLLNTGEEVANLDTMDRPSGVLRVWFVLLEGLASATIMCPRRYQPHALDTLFQLLRDLLYIPGWYLCFPSKNDKKIQLNNCHVCM